MYTPKTEIYDRSLSLVDTVILFKSGQVKLVFRLEISPLSNMPTLTYNMTNSTVCILQLIFVTYKVSYI